MRHEHARQSDREAIDPAVEQMLAKADRHGACYISEAGESYNISSRDSCDRPGELFGPPLSPSRCCARPTAGRALRPEGPNAPYAARRRQFRSEEHKSEIQSLMRSSYADFCLQKNNTHN